MGVVAPPFFLFFNVHISFLKRHPWILLWCPLSRMEARFQTLSHIRIVAARIFITIRQYNIYHHTRILHRVCPQPHVGIILFGNVMRIPQFTFLLFVHPEGVRWKSLRVCTMHPLSSAIPYFILFVFLLASFSSQFSFRSVSALSSGSCCFT